MTTRLEAAPHACMVKGRAAGSVRTARSLDAFNFRKPARGTIVHDEHDSHVSVAEHLVRAHSHDCIAEQRPRCRHGARAIQRQCEYLMAAASLECPMYCAAPQMRLAASRCIKSLKQRHSAAAGRRAVILRYLLPGCHLSGLRDGQRSELTNETTGHWCGQRGAVGIFLANQVSCENVTEILAVASAKARHESTIPWLHFERR